MDWRAIKDSVQCDEDFLLEISNDLIDETENAYIEMKKAILKNDINSIFKLAHKVKGTAKYVYCAELSTVCERIQKNAKDPMTRETIEDLAILLEDYNKVLTKLKLEVSNYFDCAIRK